MVDHSAFSIPAAKAWTRIATLLVDADLSGGAIRVEHAFRLAALTGVTKVFRQTLTDGRSVLVTALGVGTARERHARVRLRLLGSFDDGSCKKRNKDIEAS